MEHQLAHIVKELFCSYQKEKGEREREREREYIVLENEGERIVQKQVSNSTIN